MFRGAYHSSSGAPNCICLYTHVAVVQPGQRPVTTCVYKPEDANTV
jgi:hypothetical protein